MGILKLGLYATIIVIALPSTPPDDQLPLNNAGALGETQAYVSAASDIFSDANDLCNRQPSACITVQALTDKLERKAKYAIQLVNSWASDGSTDLQNADQLQFSESNGEVQQISRNTLRIEDLLPKWRGPQMPKGS